MFSSNTKESYLMKIALVWKSDYPWDVRVEKMSNTLIAYGHDVHILARNQEKKKTEEEVGGARVHRLLPFKVGAVNSASSMPAFFNLYWTRFIYKTCKRNKIDLIIVRDLPLVVNSVIAARLLGVPVVFDMAELYSAMWHDQIKDGEFHLLHYFFKNPVVAKYLERFTIRFVDHTFAVVDEARDALVALGAKKESISIVSNTPDLSKYEVLNAARPLDWKGKRILFYHGYINVGRGLEVVINSMPELLKHFGDIQFVLVGEGEGIALFKSLCRKLGVEEQVKFAGWMNFDKIPTLIRHSDICVVPHLATEHKNTTIPNKIFDYMACKKPIIVSDARPLKRIVEEERCGAVFESGDTRSFVKAVRKLLGDPAKAKKIGENGYKAVISKYNWTEDSKRMNAVIKSLYKKKR